MNREFFQRFLAVFSIHIYSENRGTPEHFKHFVTVKFLKWRVFHTFWRTGTDSFSFWDNKKKDFVPNMYPNKKHKKRLDIFRKLSKLGKL